MERFNTKLESKLQETYWEFIMKRSREYMDKKLNGRLVIDFRGGIVNGLQDQALIAGMTALNFGLDKLNNID